MSEHTPGPWIFHRETSCDRGDFFGIEAPAPHFWVIPPMNINPADARLIAAAPDLLEVLEQYLSSDEMSEGYGCGLGDESLRDRARAVIAKATGENHE